MKSNLLFLFVLYSLLSVNYVFASEKQATINFTQLTELMTDISKQRNIPSLSMSITTPEGVQEFHYHHPDLSQQKTYGIGSTTKLLAAVLVMSLVEEGKLQLNDKLSKWLDFEQFQSIQAVEQLSVLNLLKQESGIPDYANNPNWMQAIQQNKAPKSFAEKIQLIAEQDFSSTGFAYSNSNYLLLEKIVEKATGKTYQNAFNEFYSQQGIDIYLDPKNQRTETSQLSAFFAQTKNQSNNVSALQEHYGFDGGAYASTTEMQKFLTQFFINKRLISADSVSLMQTWQDMHKWRIPIGSGEISDYGMGLMKLNYAGQTWIGHMGGTIKYQSFVFFNESSQTYLVLMVNASGRHYNNTFFQELVPALLDAVG